MENTQNTKNEQSGLQGEVKEGETGPGETGPTPTGPGETGPVDPLKVDKLNEIVEAQKVADAKQLEDEKKAKNNVKLFNAFGKEVSRDEYFFKGIIPAGFIGTCGKPVDREDLVNLFHKVFRPEDNILFYKQADKEVYIIIIPIKYATEVGDSQDSIDGDFQKHAISFLTEGSVNLDTMRQKLEKVNKFVKYADR